MLPQAHEPHPSQQGSVEPATTLLSRWSRMRRASRVGVAAVVAVAVTATVATGLATADQPAPTASASAEPTIETSPNAPAPTTSPAPSPTTAPSDPTEVANPPANIPTAPPTARIPLRKGMVGAKVTVAQQRLGWLGYPISADSKARQLYGASTVSAVRAFQAKHWLPVTGKIDKRTWRKLARMAEPVGVVPLRCTQVKKAICIDKTTRLLRYVVNGKVKMVADARFGAPGMETDDGLFAVHEKSYNHVSSKYHSWMPRAMFFNRDEAVHYSPDFVSVGYSRGSHGCVGLRDMEKATWLFNQVPVGTRVYVYWS